MANIPVALQLYTVRDLTETDFVGTVKQVSEMGYAGVEMAGNTGGMSPAALRAFLGDLGLGLAGSHVGIEQLESNLDQVIEDNLTLGNPWVVCPYMPDDRRQDAAGWRAVAGVLSEIGAKVKAAGLQLCYHNHSFEYETFDGETGFDIFYGAADAELVQAEIDTYWVQHGGGDPADWCARMKHRMPVVHVKDMIILDGQQTMAEVGEGNLNWPRIIDACRQAGVQWYAVEQDVCHRDPFESMAISLRNLQAMGLE